MPPSRPVFQRPSAFDVLIDSRVTVGLIRLVALVIAVYVLTSLIVQVRDGRWMVGFGPFATEHRKEVDRQQLQRQLKEAEDRVEALEQEYAAFVLLVQQTFEGVQNSEGADGNGEVTGND